MFSSYIEEHVDFVQFSGALEGGGGMAAFRYLGSAFEGHGFPPPANTSIPTIDVGRTFRDGCIRLQARVLQCPWCPIVSKSGPAASKIGPNPLQGAPAGDLPLAERSDTSKELS